MSEENTVRDRVVVLEEAVARSLELLEHGRFGEARLFRKDRPLEPLEQRTRGRAHDAGLEVYTWTLRPENRFLAPPHSRGSSPAAWGDWQREFELILGTGIDGVFADHPDLPRALLPRT